MLCLDQMVAEQSFVRIIDAFVDALDLKQFNFTYFALNKEGRPPFHPSALLKLYLYGYKNGIRSCRKLEHACHTNIEIMWLINEQKPHFKTIANFRKDNTQAFRNVFRHFVYILKEWKLIEGKTIAIDSFKIRAQNSLKNNFNQRKITRHLKYIDDKIAEYETALDKEPPSDEVKILNDKINYNNQKKANYQQVEQQLKQSGDGQISTTDPDAKAVIFQRNSVKVGYNIQAASDAKHKLLIACDTGDVNDTKALSVMVDVVAKNIATKNFDVIADKGYHSGREIKYCEEKQIDTYISPKESSSTKKNPQYAMSAFSYNQTNDTYTCPQNQTLTTNGRWYNKNLSNGRKSYQVKHYKTKACSDCPVKNQCTKSVRGRYIERTEFQEYIESNNNRVNKNPDYYRTRQQIIEHQFGTLKRHWHFDYCLLKGKQKVLAEVAIIFSIYNLKRITSILGFKETMAKIKAIFHQIHQILKTTTIINHHIVINN